ncbi:MAG: hypothetical protein KJ985_07815, partial [Proteobacteria bacterium]|nr:hypothetical protein [Pseudomonadota bacterium]
MIKKIVLRDDEMPTQWYNVAPDIPNGLLPPLDPVTKQPMGPEKLGAISSSRRTIFLITVFSFRVVIMFYGSDLNTI